MPPLPRLVLTVALGLLASPVIAGRPPHPEPRVIVDVQKVRGPHEAAKVQRSARFGWNRIVRCYKSTGAKETGTLTLQLGVFAGGQVTSSKKTASTLDNAALTQCLAHCLVGLDMPKAAGRSTATLSIYVAPGDPPADGEKN